MFCSVIQIISLEVVMPRIFEWLGGLMFLIALMEFLPNPKKALQSIPEVLNANPIMINNHLVMPKRHQVAR